MKKPKGIAKIQKISIEETINRMSDKPHWELPTTLHEDTLVNITFRAPKNLKLKLESQAKANKAKGESPNTVTDFLLRAINLYITLHPEEFQN